MLGDLSGLITFFILSGISYAVFYGIARICQWEEDRERVNK